MKISFIGLGNLGMPCAETIAKAHYDVIGYDITEKKSNNLKIVDSIKEAVYDRDIVFVSVPTPHDREYDGSCPSSHLFPKDFNYDIVKQSLQNCNRYMNKQQILVLISTVLPGTIREYLIDLVPNTNFIYNPYLIAMGNVEWDMIHPEMIIIGTETGKIDKFSQKLIDLYNSLIENDSRYEVGTWDECECIKIFYNTFISMKISFVNMIQDVAERQKNINVDVVTRALSNSKMRILSSKYMTAGMGDAGACHPRDNIALRYLVRKLNLGYDIFNSIIKAREIQALNLAKELVKHAENNNMKIFIHGKSYKPDVEYCHGSYSLLVGHFCKELGHDPTYIDPLTGDNLETCYGVVLLAHNRNITYDNNDSQNLYCEIREGSIIVDPWRSFISKKYKVIHYGNTRENYL